MYKYFIISIFLLKKTQINTNNNINSNKIQKIHLKFIDTINFNS